MIPKQGKDRIKEAVRKAFARYKSATLDVYSLRGPVARAATQVHDEATLPEPVEPSEPSEPPDTPDRGEAIQREIDGCGPFRAGARDRA